MPSTLPTNQSIPASAVIPVLLYASVPEATSWLCRAFGFTERLRIGTHRVQLNSPGGLGALVVAKGDPPGPNSSASVMVRVRGVDDHFRAACANGARVIRAPETHVYGERQYTVVDPYGHVWTFTESIQDVAPSSWGGEYFGEGANAGEVGLPSLS